MTNPTSNFGWQMPTSTDLVTDLPADFEVFGQAVDTSLADLKGGTTGQVLKKNTDADMDFVWSADAAGMTNPMTTTGDTIYSSSGSTPARLGIGTAGQVLQVNSGATAPEWATPTSGGTGGYTLLNTGGTALTGASQITVSGITSNDLLIFMTGASSASASSLYSVKFNNSSTNHYAVGARFVGNSSWAASNFDQAEEVNSGRFPLAYSSTTANRPSYGYLMVQACTSTGVKPVWFAGANDGSSGTGNWSYSAGGYFNAAAAITSVSVLSQAGNFNGGTLYVYGRS